jgi:hypothetical protein
MTSSSSIPRPPDQSDLSTYDTLPRRHRIGGRPDRLDVIEREIDDEVRTRFPGVAVRQVALLQYG